MDTRYSLAPKELRDMIFEYLIVNCYPETAKALIRDETARQDRMGLIAQTQRIEGLEPSQSTEEKRKQAKETVAIESARKRKEIQDSILWGDISGARKGVEVDFPIVLDTTTHKMATNQPTRMNQGATSVNPTPKTSQCYGWTYPHSDLLDPANLGVEMQIQDFLETSRTISVPHPGHRLAQWRRTGRFDPAPAHLDSKHDEDTEDSSSAASSQDDMVPSTPSSPLYTSRAALDVKPDITGGALTGPPNNRLSDPNSRRHHLLLSKTQSLIVAINKLDSPDARRDYMEELGDVTGILAYERPEIALKNRRSIHRLEGPGGRAVDGLQGGAYNQGRHVNGRGRYGSPMGRARPQEGTLTTDACIHDWLGIHRRISLAQSINEAMLYHTGHSPVPLLHLIASQTTVVFECLRLGGCYLPNQDERNQLKLQPLSRGDIVEREKHRQRQRGKIRKAWSVVQVGRKLKEEFGSDGYEMRNQKGWIDMMVGWVGVANPLSVSSTDVNKAMGTTGVDWEEYEDDEADSDDMHDDILNYHESSHDSSEEQNGDDNEGSDGSGSETDDLSIYPFDVATWLDASEGRDRKARRKKKREIIESRKRAVTDKAKRPPRIIGHSAPTPTVRVGSSVTVGPNTRVVEDNASSDESSS